jgi:ADP-ribose pyrophosphatase YjhB (NUDIX family)
MRMACPACGFIHYRNPTVGVATVILDGDAILLGRRAAHSSYPGAWCIPCGHVEWEEDIREAARRECREETGLEVHVGEVVAVHSNFHNPNQHTVGVWFRCEITGGALRAGDDLDRVDWFPLTAPPEPLAFPTDRLVLQALMRRLARR